MNPKMMQLLPRVMALCSKLKNVAASGTEGPEGNAAALVKLGAVADSGASRGLLLTGEIDGEQFYIFAVGGAKSATLLSGLVPHEAK